MKIEEIETRLGDATDAELSEVLAAIGEAAKAVPAENTTENVDTLEKLAAARQAVLGEQGRRQELAARADAARGAFTEEPTTPAIQPDAGAGSSGDAANFRPEDGAADGDGDEGSGDGDDADGADDGTDGDDTVTASAKLGAITKAKRGTVKANAPKFGGQVTTQTLSVISSPTLEVGAKLDRNGLADALLEKAQTLRGARGALGRHHVARVNYNYPESRYLPQDAPMGANLAKIQAVTEPEAITAAGGLCAPLENIYDINVLGVTNRPIRDALSRFRVDRGGIQYRPPMDALAMTDGLGFWTAEMDAAVGVTEDPDVPDPSKTCAVIECPDLESAIVEAIYLCLQYPNFTARFDREWVDATTRAALIAHARFAENRLLAKLLAGSKRLTSPVAVSAVRDVLVTIDKTVAYYRNRHRLDSMVPLRMILPRWVLELFRADITRSLASVHDLAALGVADATIMTWFRARGVNVTFHLDGLGLQDPADDPDVPDADDIPAQVYANATDGSVVPPFIDKIDALLFAEGDWLFLDGGTLDLGLVRDSGLNAINRYQTFTETWEGVAFNGIESLRLVMDVQPSGGVVGTIPPALTD